MGNIILFLIKIILYKLLMKLRKIISILTEPNNLGGKFFYIDDPRGILKKYMKEYKN